MEMSFRVIGDENFGVRDVVDTCTHIKRLAREWDGVVRNAPGSEIDRNVVVRIPECNAEILGRKVAAFLKPEGRTLVLKGTVWTVVAIHSPAPNN